MTRSKSYYIYGSGAQLKNISSLDKDIIKTCMDKMIMTPYVDKQNN